MTDTPVLDKVTGVLEKRETWQATPGSEQDASVPVQPGYSAPIGAHIDREYVTSGFVNWYTNYTRVLPFPIDDITIAFGTNLYERMMCDAAVVSAVNVYRTSVLSDGVRFSPAIKDKSDSSYAQSQTIYKMCMRMWAEMETDPDDVLWNLEEACVGGNKVAEKKWVLDKVVGPEPMWRIERLNVKPRETTAFAVDAMKNIIGLLGLVPGIGFPVQIGTILIDPGKQPNLLPRDKFVLRIFRPRDNDPRGTSLVRAAYTAWNMKMELWGEFLKWLSQFASPSIIGFTAPGAQMVPKTDSEGNPVLDGNGNPTLLSPEEIMANALADMKNSTAASFPFQSQVTPIEMRGQGAPFINAFKFLDGQITQAIQHQSLTTNDSQYGTKAQASTHEDVADTIAKQGKKAILRTVTWDILRPFIRYNLGEAALPLVPQLSLGETQEQDFAAAATAISALQTAGYLDISQYPGLDEILNLPERASGWEKRMADAQAAAQPTPMGHQPGQSDNPAGARNGKVAA